MKDSPISISTDEQLPMPNTSATCLITVLFRKRHAELLMWYQSTEAATDKILR